MKFTLEINCDNASFEDGMPEEIANIMSKLSRKIEGISLSDGDGWQVYDRMGNKVGHWVMST